MRHLAFIFVGKTEIAIIMKPKHEGMEDTSGLKPEYYEIATDNKCK